MSENEKIYKVNWILIAILGWEIVFWGGFYLIHYSLGWWNEDNNIRSNILRYEHPQLLYVLFAVIPLIAIFMLNINWKNKVLKDNFASHLVDKQFKPFSTLNVFVKFFFFRNAFIFLIIALANPRFGTKKIEGKAESLEIMVALDISNSMNVADMSERQSRLESAKRGITQLINQLHGDKIGLVVFAGSAYPQLALTNDYAAAKLFVNEVSTEMISNQGTNIPDAISLATRSFSDSKTSKVIILMTDGENHEGDIKAAIERALAKNIIVSAVGFGSKNGGPIPEKGGGFKKDEQDEVVISHVNPELVIQIAKAGKGTYLLEDNAFPNFKPLLDATNSLEKGTVEMDNFKVKEQQGLFFVLLAFCCFLISILWNTSRWGIFDEITKIK